MKDTLLLRLLYRTVPGRALLKVLVSPWISRLAGRFLSSGASRPLVSYYISRYHIDMRGIDIPENGYTSFNEFFTRSRRAHKRSARPDCLISPCDGFLSSMTIRQDTLLDVKHTKFTLQSLLQDDALAENFRNGTALIFRLTPANYHRYSYAADGRVCWSKKIPGVLHCVRPVATRTFPVFTENSREYQVIETDRFGKMVQMEVGALLVGKITNDPQFDAESIVWAGDEKGYFEFGGSTIILLFQEGVLEMDTSLARRRDANGETPVRTGEVIARLHR
ncbi:MAG: phosphatidylserine decarboxylase [Agathobacter sp.]|nr:phosphatidylserine decarboxylase [Agathobacter sp.]